LKPDGIKLDREAAKTMWELQKRYYIATLDLHLEDVGPGEARMRMPFREAVMNNAGNVHGGAIMSLCDSAFWVALATLYGPFQPTATASLTCNFLSPARPPHDLMADAKVLKAGSRIVYGVVHVFSDDRLVAHATANFLNTPIDQYRRSAHEDAQTGHVRL
jgi:acyl-CoA thioesterase